MANAMGFGSPVMNESTFQRWDEREMARSEARLNQMTLQGAINATAILLGICIAVAFLCFGYFSSSGNGGLAFGAMLIGGLGTFGLSVALMFKPNLAPKLGVVVAVLEGLFVGGVSYVYAAWMGREAAADAGGATGALATLDTSIIFQAATLTFGIAAALLVAYSTRIIRVSDTFVKVIFAATMGVAALFMVNLLLSLFGVGFGSLIFSGPLGIGISLVIVGLASANLLIDFRVVEDGVRAGAPKWMNWYAAFAILVTIVWLYVSLLRLLALLRGRE